ncbi:MAG: TonB-dependent receptor [Acidobacteria bacterium]|nr:TonB-dependent receptor [Acidobacteriota bacterium]
MKNRLVSAASALAILAGLASSPALAQLTGNIDGTVHDTSNAPLPGVSVELKSPALLGARTAVTDASGRFRFPAVPPGTYKVTSSLSGFKTVERTGVKVELGGTATLSIPMEISVTEQIVVTGEAPVVDVASTTTGTNYSSSVISKLPVGRNYADIVRSQPGVQTDSGETQGRSLALSIYGSTSAENLYLIDGNNTTNVIKGIQGKAINNEFVQEVEVKTGGYQAEFGRNTGGVVNVITKSGGNEFHGGVFGYYDSTGMKADNELEKQFKSGGTPDYSERGDSFLLNSYNDEDKRSEIGASLGGFIVKDRVWFFGAYDRVNRDVVFAQTSGANEGLGFLQEQKSDLFSGKLTFNITKSTELLATVTADPQTNDGAVNAVVTGTSDTSRFGSRDIGGTDYGFRATQLFGSMGLLTAQYAKHKESYKLTPLGANLIRVNDQSQAGSATVASGGLGQVFGPTQNNESQRDSFLGNFTVFAGNHEIKVGGDYQKDQTTGSTYYTGGQIVDIFYCSSAANRACNASAPFITNAYGNRVQVFYRHRFFSLTPQNQAQIQAAPFDVPNKLYSFYAQDAWRVLPNLTVNAGIRYDNQKVIKGDGSLAFELKNQWAPRAGFSWDILSNGSSKLYGSFGRFYWPTPTNLNVRVFTANTQIFTFNYSPTDLTHTGAGGRGQLVQGGSVDGEPVDENLKASYQDEVTAGFEKALDPTFSLGVKFTYRKLGPNTIEDRCDLDAEDPRNTFGATCAIVNSGSSGLFASGQIGVCSASENPTDPNAGVCSPTGVPVPATKRTFTGLELSAKKQVGQNLWIQASYLFSQLKGNYSGAIRVASGQTDPGINADFDYFEFARNSDGKLELDRPHQVRVDAVYQAPFGLAMGLGAYLRSGGTTNRLGYYNSFYPDLLYLDKRGSGERLETDYDANLSLSYALKLGPVTVTPQVYLFNILNRQAVTVIDEGFNANGSFVETPGANYGQAGVAPGQQRPDHTLCPAGGPVCSDNADYRKAQARNAPRSLRVALKVEF